MNMFAKLKQRILLKLLMRNKQFKTLEECFGEDLPDISISELSRVNEEMNRMCSTFTKDLKKKEGKK